MGVRFCPMAELQSPKVLCFSVAPPRKPLQVLVFQDVPDATLLRCLLCKEFRGFEA